MVPLFRFLEVHFTVYSNDIHGEFLRCIYVHGSVLDSREYQQLFILGYCNALLHMAMLFEINELFAVHNITNQDTRY